MQKSYDLIIFDCDGTLVDTEYLNNLATCQILAEEGLPQYDMDYAFKHFVGIRFNETISKISEETGHNFPDDVRQRYVDRVAELAPEHFRTMDHAEELVTEAQKHSKICVASNGQRDNVIKSLEMGGLTTYFPEEHVFTAIQVENPKPAPDLFLLAAKSMETVPGKTLVIEDSKAGVTAGATAGMNVIGFTGSHSDQAHAEDQLNTAGAFVVFQSLIHIRNFLFPKKPFAESSTMVAE